MATETAHWLLSLFTSLWREDINCFDNGSQHFCDKNKFNFDEQWVSSYNFIGWLPVSCHSCWFLLDPGTTSFIQSPVSLHCFQLRNFYPGSQAPCLFSLIPHSQSSWPCPFLPVYLPHSLVPIFSLTPSEENMPHDPVSAFSCLAQPLKPGCLTLVLCSSHFLSLLQKISIFYLICPTSAQPAEVITRRTHRAPGCPGVMLRAALNLRWSHLLLQHNSEPKCFDIWLWSNPS